MSARNKVIKPEGVQPDELELHVAQAIFDLENNVAELKADLRPLQFTAAKEVEITPGRKAVVIFVPVPQLKSFHKVQNRCVKSHEVNRSLLVNDSFRLVRELEKKFSDRHILLVAQRKIMRNPTRKSRVKQMRPRSRTLTSVHENLLEDLVFPTEIVGKRTRVKLDGSKLIKVYVHDEFAFILM